MNKKNCYRIENNLSILLLIDACRQDYIDEIHTPFLNNLKMQGVFGILYPTFGFEPDAAYIAGLYPDEANGGAQFWFSPEDSPFRFTKYLPKKLNCLPKIPDLVLRKILKEIAMYNCEVPKPTTAHIPFPLLQYIGFSKKCKMENSRFVPSKGIFDILRDNGQKWLFHGPPKKGVDINSVVRCVNDNLAPPKSFAFLHIGDLDKVGHRYGPESREIKKVLKKIDKGIEQILNVAKKHFQFVHIVIIGDHGMMQVERTVDIGSALEELPIKLGRDYLFFLDSTMARFWFFSDKAEKLISELMRKMIGGHILSKVDKQKYHLNYSHNKYGDIIFLADPGVLIFPNFYQNRKPVKGMHGYAPETPEQQSTLLIHSPRINVPKGFDEPVDMRRVFPTVLDLLGLPIPERTKAKSLLL
jgi:predicted AlkP superfamily pyrophosphatase or phosphodiesterase